MSKPQFVYTTYIETSAEKLWHALIDGDFTEHFKEAKSESVIEFLTLNPKNPNSILNCLTAARESGAEIATIAERPDWLPTPG